uniref:Uncharacterized protein n=1 Tax=Trichogramma kaykai TaxID=54128 RepID=A0ABD2WD97_9HYME
MYSERGSSESGYDTPPSPVELKFSDRRFGHDEYVHLHQQLHPPRYQAPPPPPLHQPTFCPYILVPAPYAINNVITYICSQCRSSKVVQTSPGEEDDEENANSYATKVKQYHRREQQQQEVNGKDHAARQGSATSRSNNGYQNAAGGPSPPWLNKASSHHNNNNHNNVGNNRANGHSGNGSGGGAQRAARKRARDEDGAGLASQGGNGTQEGSPSAFDESEYTRVSTPRQDMLFKKGYLSQHHQQQQQQQHHHRHHHNQHQQHHSRSSSSGAAPWNSGLASMSATPSTTESHSASHSTAGCKNLDGSEEAEDHLDGFVTAAGMVTDDGGANHIYHTPQYVCDSGAGVMVYPMIIGPVTTHMHPPPVMAAVCSLPPSLHIPPFDWHPNYVSVGQTPLYQYPMHDVNYSTALQMNAQNDSQYNGLVMPMNSPNTSTGSTSPACSAPLSPSSVSDEVSAADLDKLDVHTRIEDLQEPLEKMHVTQQTDLEKSQECQNERQEESMSTESRNSPELEVPPRVETDEAAPQKSPEHVVDRDAMNASVAHKQSDESELLEPPSSPIRAVEQTEQTKVKNVAKSIKTNEIDGKSTPSVTLTFGDVSSSFLESLNDALNKQVVDMTNCVPESVDVAEKIVQSDKCKQNSESPTETISISIQQQCIDRQSTMVDTIVVKTEAAMTLPTLLNPEAPEFKAGSLSKSESKNSSRVTALNPNALEFSRIENSFSNANSDRDAQSEDNLENQSKDSSASTSVDNNAVIDPSDADEFIKRAKCRGILIEINSTKQDSRRSSSNYVESICVSTSVENVPPASDASCAEQSQNVSEQVAEKDTLVTDAVDVNSTIEPLSLKAPTLIENNAVEVSEVSDTELKGTESSSEVSSNVEEREISKSEKSLSVDKNKRYNPEAAEYIPNKSIALPTKNLVESTQSSSAEKPEPEAANYYYSSEANAAVECYPTHENNYAEVAPYSVENAVYPTNDLYQPNASYYAGEPVIQASIQCSIENSEYAGTHYVANSENLVVEESYSTEQSHFAESNQYESQQLNYENAIYDQGNLSCVDPAQYEQEQSTYEHYQQVTVENVDVSQTHENGYISLTNYTTNTPYIVQSEEYVDPTYAVPREECSVPVHSYPSEFNVTSENHIIVNGYHNDPQYNAEGEYAEAVYHPNETDFQHSEEYRPAEHYAVDDQVICEPNTSLETELTVDKCDSESSAEQHYVEQSHCQIPADESVQAAADNLAEVTDCDQNTLAQPKTECAELISNQPETAPDAEPVTYTEAVPCAETVVYSEAAPCVESVVYADSIPCTESVVYAETIPSVETAAYAEAVPSVESIVYPENEMPEYVVPTQVYLSQNSYGTYGNPQYQEPAVYAPSATYHQDRINYIASEEYRPVAYVPPTVTATSSYQGIPVSYAPEYTTMQQYPINNSSTEYSVQTVAEFPVGSSYVDGVVTYPMSRAQAFVPQVLNSPYVYPGSMVTGTDGTIPNGRTLSYSAMHRVRSKNSGARAVPIVSPEEAKFHEEKQKKHERSSVSQQKHSESIEPKSKSFLNPDCAEFTLSSTPVTEEKNWISKSVLNPATEEFQPASMTNGAEDHMDSMPPKDNRYSNHNSEADKENLRLNCSVESQKDGIADKKDAEISKTVPLTNGDITLEDRDSVVDEKEDSEDVSSAVDNLNVSSNLDSTSVYVSPQNDKDFDISLSWTNKITSENFCHESTTTTMAAKVASTTSSSTNLLTEIVTKKTTIEVPPSIATVTTDEDSGVDSQQSKLNYAADKQISEAVNEWLKRASSPRLFITSSDSASDDDDDNDDRENGSDESDDDDEIKDVKIAAHSWPTSDKPSKNLKGNPMLALSYSSANQYGYETKIDCGRFARFNDTVREREKASNGNSISNGKKVNKQKRKPNAFLLLKGVASHKNIDKSATNISSKQYSRIKKKEDHFGNFLPKNEIDRTCNFTAKDRDVSMRVAKNSRIKLKRRGQESGQKLSDLHTKSNNFQENVCSNAHAVDDEQVKTFEKGEIIVSMQGELLLVSQEHRKIGKSSNNSNSYSASNDSEVDNRSLGSIDEPDVLECWEAEIVEPIEKKPCQAANEDATLSDSAENHVNVFYRLHDDSSLESSLEDYAAPTSVRVTNSDEISINPSGKIMVHNVVVEEETPTSINDSYPNLPLDEAYEVYESCYTGGKPLPNLVDPPIVTAPFYKTSVSPQDDPIPCKAVCCSIQ